MQVYSPLVGVSFRPKEAKEIVKSLTTDSGHLLLLEAEPDNEYDDHAIKVICHGTHIGYIARENNQQIFEALVNDESDYRIEIVSFENSIKPVLMIELLEADEGYPDPTDGWGSD